MKKKIAIFCMMLAAVQSYSFTDDSNGFNNDDRESSFVEYGTSSTYSTEEDDYDDDSDTKKEDDKVISISKEEYNKEKEKSKETEEKTSGGLGDFFRMILEGDIPDTAFNYINIIGTTASSVLATIGSLPTIFGNGAPGAAGAANTIQTILQKMNDIKTRIDQLKHYKQYVESLKGLSDDDKNFLDKINLINNGLSNIMNDATRFINENKSYLDVYRNNDLSKPEGWNELMEIDMDMKKLNENVTDFVVGEKSNKIFKEFQRTKNKINSISATTEKGELEKISHLLNHLISLTEQQISQAAAISSTALAEENRRLEEELAIKEQQRKEIEELNGQINELQRRNRHSALGSKFVGDITGK